MAAAANNGYSVPRASVIASAATGGYNSASMAIPKRLDEQSTPIATTTALHCITAPHGIDWTGEEVICVGSKPESEAGSEPMDLESQSESESGLTPSVFSRPSTEESSRATSISSEQTATTVLNTPRATLFDLAEQAELMRDLSDAAHNSPGYVYSDTSPCPEREPIPSGDQHPCAPENPSTPTVEPETSWSEDTEAARKVRPKSFISDRETQTPVPLGPQPLRHADICLRDSVSHNCDGDAIHTTLCNGDNDTSVNNNKDGAATGNGSDDDNVSQGDSGEDDDDGDEDDNENGNGNDDSDYICSSSESEGEEAKRSSFASRRNGGKKRRYSPPDKPGRPPAAKGNLTRPFKRPRCDHSRESRIPGRIAHSEPPRIPSPQASYYERAMTNCVLKSVFINGIWVYTLTFEGLNESSGRPQVQPPRDAGSLGRRKFSEEEDNLLIELRSSGKLSWKEIFEEFDKRFPSRTQASIQVHCSTKLKGRIKEAKPKSHGLTGLSEAVTTMP